MKGSNSVIAHSNRKSSMLFRIAETIHGENTGAIR
jgi:hypothetical protein